MAESGGTRNSGMRHSVRGPDTHLASLSTIVQRMLEMYGLDGIEIWRRAGVDLAEIHQPSARLPVDQFDTILQATIESIDDTAFGLKAARCWHPSNLGVLGHVWITSSTLRSGLNRVARYYRLLGERGNTEIEDTRQGIRVSFHDYRENAAVSSVVADMVLSILLDMCRMNAGAALRPIEVSLRRPAPENMAVYGHFYGCPVRFGAEVNAFVLAAADVDRPLPSSNRQLAALFDKMLTEEIARLDKSDIVSRCKASLLEHLASGEVSEEDTAKQLHMSPRTLQRKLAQEGTTYAQLVDDTRRDLALRYIADPNRSITDITFLLGFSYPSAFTRADTRWTGKTPTESRVQS